MKWVIGVTFGVTYGVILLVTKYVKIIKKKKLEKKRDALIKLLDFIKKLN
jgi:ABC-type methionine transport system permease subunit